MLTANWSMNPHVDGTKDWAIMQWLWAFGLLLYVPRGVWSDWLSIVIANTSIVIGSFYMLRGFSKYQKIPLTPKYLEFLGIGIMFFGYYYWTFIEESLHFRVILLSLFGFLVMLRVLFILQPVFKEKTGVALVVGIGIALHGFFFLSKALFTMWSEPQQSLLDGGAGGVWMMLESIVFIFWSTISFALLTNLRLQNDLKLLADKDPLTNLFNRRAIFEMCQKSIKIGAMHSVSVLVLDLDRFKSINDNFGHAIGDKVLKHFAKLVSEVAPKNAMFGRTGGEEFIVVLPNPSMGLAEETAKEICKKTRDALIIVEGKNLYFTVSVGISSGVLELSTDLRKIINNADKAMYEAKSKGRDCYHKSFESPAIR